MAWHKKRLLSNNQLLGIIGLIVVIQAYFFGYSLMEFRDVKELILENSETILSNNEVLTANINSINQELQSLHTKSSELSQTISTTQQELSETQSNLENQISSIKAKTSSDFSGIISDAVNSVVSIKTNVAQGTGFIITDDGYVITNAHVLEGASYAKAITAEQDTISMDLIGYSSTLDLALLKISGSYESLEFADSDDIKVGEKVIAIGNPYGLSFSVSEGIVSATGRKVSSYGGRYIQTDAALNSGNSGGPLINTDGEVLGINNFKIEGDNIGFALESNYIKEGVNEISLEKLGIEIL